MIHRVAEQHAHQKNRTLSSAGDECDRREELERRRERLSQEYELARSGLATGRFSMGIGLVSAIATMLVALASIPLARASHGQALFSGTELVVLFVVMIVAIVVYFAFVFGRVLRIRVELSDVERKISIEAGESTR